MKVDAVFFDLDGTLLDTAKDLGGALNTVLSHHNKPTLPLEQTSQCVSNGAAALVELGFGLKEGDTGYDAIRQELLDCYLADIAQHTQAYAGIYNCIFELASHGIAWGIVTNKPWPYAEPLMTHFEFATPPCAIICPEHVKEKKPAPDGLLLACEKANCPPSHTIYVGDHIRDIQCGQQAGSKTIAASYGYISEGDNPNNWGADHTVTCGTQIWPIIETYINA